MIIDQTAAAALFRKTSASSNSPTNFGARCPEPITRFKSAVKRAVDAALAFSSPTPKPAFPRNGRGSKRKRESSTSSLVSRLPGLEKRMKHFSAPPARDKEKMTAEIVSSDPSLTALSTIIFAMGEVIDSIEQLSAKGMETDNVQDEEHKATVKPSMPANTIPIVHQEDSSIVKTFDAYLKGEVVEPVYPCIAR